MVARILCLASDLMAITDETLDKETGGFCGDAPNIHTDTV